jgi:hypothetical protein
MPRQRNDLLWVVLLLVGIALIQKIQQVTGDDENNFGDRCDPATSSYQCTNCGGILVNDCMDCHGYLHPDATHNMCVARKLLFHAYNTSDSSNPGDGRHHLWWRDLVGLVVWFVSAGVATACGVGGGGIYVPLGIILLNFAPKSSSGLSQAR